jgi:hypothetical protein
MGKFFSFLLESEFHITRSFNDREFDVMEQLSNVLGLQSFLAIDQQIKTPFSRHS